MQSRKIVNLDEQRQQSVGAFKPDGSAYQGIDDNLRRAFSSMEKEPVPQQFHALIARLREKE